MTDLETKAYEYFNRVIGDENVRFEIEEITENSFIACVYGKCDFWIKTAADNPLTAAKRAIRAYKLLKHGEALIKATDSLACELADSLSASVDELFAGTSVGKQAAEALAPFAAPEVE